MSLEEFDMAKDAARGVLSGRISLAVMAAAGVEEIRVVGTSEAFALVERGWLSLDYGQGHVLVARLDVEVESIKGGDGDE